MAGIGGPPDAAMTSTDVERDLERPDRATRTVAWSTVVIGAWLIGGVFVDIWASVHGLASDPAASIFIIPFYLGILVLAVASITLAIRASRQGRGWRRAFPPGYGVLGVGIVVLFIGLLVDVGWREGVGIARNGIEPLLAPSRLLVLAGLIFVAIGPFRSALSSTGAVASRWAAVVSACLVLAVSGLPGGFHPAASPWLERAPSTADAEVWLMDRDGHHQTRLIEAHDGFMAWNAVWSPDGKRIAYTRLRLGNRPPVDIPDEADIWVVDADGTHAHPLVEGPDWQWLPHWSPDGTWIAYTDEPEGGPWAAAGPAGFGGGGILGTGLGFGSSNPVRTYADIWRVRADGTGSPERLTDAPGDDRAATYSPDGMQLAFDSTRAGGTDIFVMGADGSSPRQLTFNHGFTWGATWSPDGKAIAFNSWQSNNQDIYRMGADGRGTSRMTTDPAQELEPSWSPNGQRIAYRRLSGEPRDGGDIWSMAADGSDPTELTRSPATFDDLTSGGGAWGPDGRIAFVRGFNPDVTADPLVREDLAVAEILLTAMLLALLAVLLARIDPPFGAFAILIAVPTALYAAISDQGRFIPAAVVGGLIVDVMVRLVPDRWKTVTAGAGSAAALVVGAEITVALTGGLGWSPTLLSGVAVAAAGVGWGLAAAAGRSRSSETRSHS